LHNYSGGDRDSAGLFQQRPSMGWGTLAQVRTPTYAARKFYEVLLKVPGWQVMSVSAAAQRVQRSAFPNAYAKWEAAAAKLAADLMGVANIADLGGGAPGAPCGADQFGPVPVGPGGWVVPVKVPKIFSPFGMRHGVLHPGVDLSPPIGTPIRAAATGVVEAAGCNSNTGRCDGPTSSGYGNYMDIRHPGNVVTRYGHMRDLPLLTVGQTVTAGQVIGFVGQSGHATGPHLHFEVHVGVPKGTKVNNSNAIDPVGFMKAAGAPLPPCCY
jgi:murein DD-endopeptidase MepM/ murein hydrolase activator NlpD